jgi:folate-binding protein YgfZ
VAILELVATTSLPELAADYETLTSGCGMIDRSERGKLRLDGPDAVDFLNGQVTNELADLHVGEGRYAAFLTHKGKMLGDLRILAAGAEDGQPPAQLLLDTERVALQPLFDMIRRFKVGYRVELVKRTLEDGLVSLIGPRTDEVLGTAAPPASEHAHTVSELDGVPVRAIRTELGADLLCAAEQAGRLGETLRGRGAREVSEAAVECVRVEHGRPRYGIDLDDSVIPQEGGLNERAVSFTKGCYVGQETVARLHWRGKPNRHLRGLLLSAPASSGDQLRLGERVAGRLTSPVVSPRVGPIALALVRREAEPGSVLAVGDGGTTAEVVVLPFER